MSGASALRLERPGDASAFESAAGPFLCEREAENNLCLGLTSAMKAGRSYGTAVYFGVVRQAEHVVGVALRAGLYLIVTAGTTDPALRLLIEDAAAATPDAPGIVGPKELAQRAVELWTARTGQRAKLQMAERIYRLCRVIAPRHAPGSMRRAEPGDLDVVADWFFAFGVESQPHLRTSREDARDNARRWIEGGGLRVWTDQDAPRSMAGATGPTPHGIRIGAVYTPPPLRARGYASALVAALSQEQLDS